MVPNIKYYVITIASIFLALGVGIFMGFMLDAQGLVSSQREDIVAQLEEKFDELQEESENTKKDMEIVDAKNEELNKFLEESFPLVVKDGLLNKNIAVVEVNKDYSYSELEKLELSGAKVTSTTKVGDNLKQDEEVIRNLYKEIKGQEFEGELYAMVSGELSFALTSGMKSPFIDKLVELGYVTVDGAYGAMNEVVLIAGGSGKEENQTVDMIKNLIEDIKEAGKMVVGVEKSDVAVSNIEVYKQARISSVDNVDTLVGKTSLIIVIRGVSGNFGTKDTAVEAYPNLSNLLER